MRIDPAQPLSAEPPTTRGFGPSALTPVVRPKESEKSAPAPAAAAEKPAPVAPLQGRLTIEFDREARVFVQTLKSAETDEVLRKYPNENQLAFARAARAYQIALSETS